MSPEVLEAALDVICERLVLDKIPKEAFHYTTSAELLARILEEGLKASQRKGLKDEIYLQPQQGKIQNHDAKIYGAHVDLFNFAQENPTVRVWQTQRGDLIVHGLRVVDGLANNMIPPKYLTRLP